jgi:hypothetical protein
MPTKAANSLTLIDERLSIFLSFWRGPHVLTRDARRRTRRRPDHARYAFGCNASAEGAEER